MNLSLFGSRRVLGLLAGLVVGVGTAGAQAPAPASGGLLARPGPPSRTVHLDVVVTRKSGEAVSGLQAKDFTLLDDKKPAEITSFEAVDTAAHPVEALLLIDSVNTPYTVISQERYQIDKFLRANGGKLSLPTAVAVLADSGLKMQKGYTRDGNALADVLAKYTIGLRDIGRSAGVEGAAERLDDSLKAMRLLLSYEQQRPGRKIVMWISPGWPLLSGPRMSLTGEQMNGIFSEITWLSQELRETQTTVYAVDPLGVGESVGQAFYYEQFVNGVKKPSDVNFGNMGLQVLAIQSGGKALNSTDVDGLLRQCVEANVAYYRISFEPAPTERRDVYHELKVQTADRDLTALTSTGYYAEP